MWCITSLDLHKHFIGGLKEVTLHTAFTAIAMFASYVWWVQSHVATLMVKNIDGEKH